jgi:carboxymethylenebutenolidase
MVPGGNMPVYYARLANAQNPPIVLVAMEIFGLHEYIKDVTRRLGHLGAFAVAPDYYSERASTSRSRRYGCMGEVAGR